MRHVACALLGLAAIAAAGPAAAAAPAPAPAVEAAPGATDFAPVIARLSREIPALMAQNRVAGLSIALVDGPRVVWARGFGFADLAARRRVTADTLFHIGSVSKVFSATAVMQLAERGLVDLDAPLERYVPRLSLKPRFRGNVITLRTVLSHHSGLPGDIGNGLITTGRPDPGYRARLLGALRAMYPTRRVNTLEAYDNSGNALLQNVVENVTGTGLEAYAQRRLFGPMGMGSSNFDDRRAPASQLTRNYEVISMPGKPTAPTARPREFVNGWATGSITSSARDMAGFLQMLLARGRGTEGRVLRPGTLRAMWTRQTAPPLDRWAASVYGLGWELRDPQLAWAGPVRHKGGDTIYNHSMVKLLPRSGLGVFVSINTLTTGDLQNVVTRRALTLAYTAKTGRRPPPRARLPRSGPVRIADRALRAHAGFYASNAGLDRVEVASDGGGLVWTRGTGTPSSASATYRPSRDGWFRSATDRMFQIGFRTVEGRRLMLVRAAIGTARITATWAERVPAGAGPPAEWSARLGRYRAADANARTAPGLVPFSARLSDVGGLLVLDTGAEAGRQVLEPASATVAFTFGLGAVGGRQKGDSLTAFRTGEGREGFTYQGVRYLKV